MALRVTREYADVLGSNDGAARVTRQYVEIVAAGAVDARVSRQYVEIIASLPTEYLRVTRQCVSILGDPPEANEIFATATDTLVVTEEAVGFQIYTAAASDTLELDDASPSVKSRPASDDFDLTDSAEATKQRPAEDTLALSDEATRQIVISRSAQDTIELDDDAHRIITYTLSKREQLHLQDSAEVEVIHVITDTLELDDEALATHVAYAFAEDSLASLSDSADREVVFNQAVDDSLSIEDEATRTLVVSASASDSMDWLSEDTVVHKIRPASDTLSLSDEADAERIRAIIESLSLSDEANAGIVVNRSRREQLRLVDSAAGWHERVGTASDSLGLSDRAAKVSLAEDSLTLADSASAYLQRSVSDDLLLDDSAAAYRIRPRGEDELLGLTDSATCGKVYNRSATDVLQHQFISYGPPPDYEEIISYIGLDDSASCTVVRAEIPLEDSLRLRDRAKAYILNEEHVATAEDSLELSDAAYRTPQGITDDVLLLTDSAAATLAKPVVDALELDETASRSVVLYRNATDALELSEGTLAYNALEDYLYVYHPFVGAGPSTNPTPPSIDLEGPIPGITDPFKLVYPTVGPFSDTLVLRAPNLGNRDRLQMTRISREMRGGTLIVFADPMWPKIQTLVLNFSGLTWAEASGLHTFMDDHLGQEIGVLDWEHRYWTGVITNLGDPIVHDGRGCQYSVGFEFEGELATYDPGP